MTTSAPTIYSPLETIHDPYFVQRVAVRRELQNVPRFEVFRRILANRSVLHVGYADWPITTIEANLHVQLDTICSRLDGVDPHDEAAALIRPHVKGKLFTSLGEVNDRYEVLLVPEVIEHVGDVATFLSDLHQVEFNEVIITAPDAYSCRNFFDFPSGSAEFIEVVHPDHHAWYSPYTLSNLVAKFTDWTIEGVWFVNAISLMLVASKRSASESSNDNERCDLPNIA